MNSDDPKFTAYALGELDPVERAEIEVELASNPALREELDGMIGLVSGLREELMQEEGERLTAEQRATVLGNAVSSAAQKVVARPAPWWRAAGFLSAAAACVVVGIGAWLVGRAQSPYRHVAETNDSERPGIQILPDPALSTSVPEIVDLSHSGGTPRDPANLSSSVMHFNGDTSQKFGESARLTLRLPKAGNLEGSEVKLMLEANGFYDTGRYDLATNRIQRVLSTQPDNSEALALQTEINARKKRLPEMPYNETRSRMISQIPPQAEMSAQSDTYASNQTTQAGKPLMLGPFRGAVSGRSQSAIQKEIEALRGRLASLDGEPDKKDEGRNVAGQLKRLQAELEAVLVREEGLPNTESYDAVADNPFLAVTENPLSTFSVDVDTASYSNVRRYLNTNMRPPKGAVRIEELLNYFRYDYPKPSGADPFGCGLEVATCPWTPDHRLVRIGIKGREFSAKQRPPANLVLLVDVSGSMDPENKLPLVKSSLRLLTDQLSPEDSVAIAVYAGSSGCVLDPTHDKEKVRQALEVLRAGGSTNGASGINLAYDLAQRAFKRGGVNRVILCTDGDFNVGISDQSQLVSLIQDKAKTGIFLSVFGFGMGNLKDSTLEKLADKGNGTYGYIDSISEGRRVFVEQMVGTLVTIAKDVKLQIEFNPAQVASYRLIGYENRVLAKEDFNDDARDAGEIGAGHTVTALYEVVPVGKPAPATSQVDELKYAPKSGSAGVPPPSSREMLTVKVRYKQPDGDKSTKLEFPLTDPGTSWENSSRDFRWASAVAGFGMMLRESPHRGSMSWSLIMELASGGLQESKDTDRAEFVGLIDRARALTRPPGLVK